MNGFIYKARVCLIRLGKALPFLVCFIVSISYLEALHSLITNSYVVYDDHLLLNQELSWCIGKYCEYNIQMLIVITIISIAIETCYWNKFAILYLLFQLGEKSYFATIELYTEQIYIVVLVNILISTLLTIKGLTIYLQKKK